MNISIDMFYGKIHFKTFLHYMLIKVTVISFILFKYRNTRTSYFIYEETIPRKAKWLIKNIFLLKMIY